MAYSGSNLYWKPVCSKKQREKKKKKRERERVIERKEELVVRRICWSLILSLGGQQLVQLWCVDIAAMAGDPDIS